MRRLVAVRARLLAGATARPLVRPLCNTTHAAVRAAGPRPRAPAPPRPRALAPRTHRLVCAPVLCAAAAGRSRGPWRCAARTARLAGSILAPPRTDDALLLTGTVINKLTVIACHNRLI